MTNQTAKRKRAYAYMMEEVKRLNWIPPIDSDKRLAETLDIPIDELNSLKECSSNPSEKMITAFKSLVCVQWKVKPTWIYTLLSHLRSNKNRETVKSLPIGDSIAIAMS